jgi:transcriptional regulator with XRE-family HTH domain
LAGVNNLNEEHSKSMREAALGQERSMCDKFRHLREERGWSQQDISDKLAVMGLEMHQTTVAKMEKGRRPLRVAEMFALSWVFGLPPGAVFWVPATDKLPHSLRVMSEELADIDAMQNQMRAEFMRMFESHMALYGDLDSRRASLTRAMRDAGADLVKEGRD